MRKTVALALAATVSTGALANLTSFVPPVATGGGYSGGSFNEGVAHGFYGAGPGAFDNHWLFTVDAFNPEVTVTVDNSFNPSTGGGALTFSLTTLTGPGIVSVALPTAAVPCINTPFPGECHTRREATLSLVAGAYDLHVTGSNPFNGLYSVTIAVVPEPGTWALFAAGLAVLIIPARRSRTRAR